MKLFRIDSLYVGKDMNSVATFGYVLAESDEAVYKMIEDEMYSDTGWAGYYSEKNSEKIREKILKNKGDFNEKYMGEFYDIKYQWEDLGMINDYETIVLNRFKILWQKH